VFVDFVDLSCLVHASQPVEPVQASSPCFIIMMPEADIVNPSSNDN
jgi:hypothetical protein